jgi:hypothetical protein
MMVKKSKKSHDRTADVVGPLRPWVVKQKQAATIIGRSETWLKERRIDDTKRIAAGLEPLGPRWLAFENGIVYRLDELERWFNSRVVECGRVPWRGEKLAEVE